MSAATNNRPATSQESADYKEGKKMQTAEQLAAAFVDNETEENETTLITSINDSDGDVSVTKADKKKAVVDEDAKKQMSFTAGPKFQDALEAELFTFNKQLIEAGKTEIKMSAFLRNKIAISIGFDLTLDPVKTKSKYATDEERKAAIKASQEKAKEEKKKLNQLISMAKNKSTRAQAIAALMESLGITDDDVE